MNRSEFIKYLILNIFYFPLFCILSYVVPKNKRLILLGASFGKNFSGNPKYYYLYLVSNRDKINFNFYWVTSNKKVFHDLKQKKYPVLYFFSMKAFFYILRAECLLIDNAARDITYTMFLNGRFNIIQTWHGIPLKNIFDKEAKSFSNKFFHYLLKKERELYKTILSCSNYDAKILSVAISNKNIRIIGYPRNDIFFNKHLSFINYKQKLNLDKYNRILLYAPTFRDGQELINPFSKDFLVQFNDYLRKNNYILLIKNHPLFGNKLKFSAFKNIQNISDIIDDIQEVLIHVDVLINDYSSIFFDFSLLAKPIIFYIYDYENYVKKCRNLYLNYSKDLPWPTAKDENKLFELVENVDLWSKDKKYFERYKKFNSRFHYYQDGKSCERLHNLIINSLKS